jgi:hypothetical protein
MALLHGRAGRFDCEKRRFSARAVMPKRDQKGRPKKAEDESMAEMWP